MNNIRRIAVFTSGGDAPGMNSAIRSVVRTGNHFGLHVYGIFRGYEGMIKGNFKRLESGEVGNIIQRGGTMLQTARSKEFRTKEGRAEAYANLKARDIDACVAIGGDGTFTGAMIFQEEYPDIPFVGIPGTIDNDIFGTDNTIGFDTALNTAVEAVDKIRDTAASHERLFFIEVMGRHSGYIALHTGIGSGSSFIFLPETDTTIDDLVGTLRRCEARDKKFNMVIVAEGNQNGNAMEIAAKLHEKHPKYNAKVTIIGHMQRGGSPSVYDRVLASRLGYYAVKALMNGERNVALGIVDDEQCITPFEDAISKGKSPKESIIEMARIISM